jgi:hypothetical protein
MFGLEGSGFFISIMFCLLMAGSVVFYTNGKIKHLEAQLAEQGSILSQALGTIRGGAAPEAIRAAQCIVASESPSTLNSAMSDDSSESESSGSDISDEDSCDGGQGVSGIDDIVTNVGQDIANLMPPSMISGTVIISAEGAMGVVHSGSEMQEITAIDRSVKTIKLADVEDLDKLGLTEVCETQHWEKKVKADPNVLEHMKVAELREIAADLTDVDGKKMRKSELIQSIKGAVSQSNDKSEVSN